MSRDTMNDDKPWKDAGWQARSIQILESFHRAIGRELIPGGGSVEVQAKQLFEAPFVVAAHNSDADPILNYGNRAALQLWEMDLETFLQTPSRKTAEPMAREERAGMLAKAARQGYIDDYRGIRITSSGRRFAIEQAIVWNITDDEGRAAGQGATFAHWRFLDQEDQDIS